jgi:hypothetical protein
MGAFQNVFGSGGGGGVATEGAKSGQIIIDLFIGDDYLASNGRSLVWPVTVPPSTTIPGSSCVLRFTRCSGTCEPFEIEFVGTITDDDGDAELSFDMPNHETATIPVGEYFFFVEWIGDSGEVITKVFNRQIVSWKTRTA